MTSNDAGAVYRVATGQQPRAWRPNWARTEATRYAWEHDAAWRADALANGEDGAQRLRLLNAAVTIFANRQPPEPLIGEQP